MFCFKARESVFMPSGQKTNIFFKGNVNIFSVSVFPFSVPCLNVVAKKLHVTPLYAVLLDFKLAHKNIILNLLIVFYVYQKQTRMFC